MHPKYLSGPASAILTFAAGLVVLGLPSAPPAAGSPVPGSCIRVINGVEWLLDPCIPEGAPLPPDLVEHVDDLAACPPESPSPSPTVSESVSPNPTPTPVRPNAATLTATPPSSPNPTGSPTRTAWPSSGPPQCPVFSDPAPWPNYPPPGSTPTPTPPDPTPSREPIPASCAESPAPGLLADPKDESADLIKCRKPRDIPDPNKPITLVGVGNSLVSAHHQTGFGLGQCDHTAADARGLKGNDAEFSFLGRYYAGNPQIVNYYNFARTGYGTREIVKDPPIKDDSCGNPWNRNANPIGLADRVVRAAKAAGHAAYFVADGGVNNTNWTDLFAQLAKCYGLDFAINNLVVRTATFPARVHMHYAVPGGGPKKDIVAKGGACIVTVKAFGFELWSTRIEVPKYDGPGSGNEDPNQSGKIKDDIAAAIQKMLDAGADKIVWMLYYDLTKARLDIANFGYTLARNQFPDWLARRLPGSVASLTVRVFDADLDVVVADLTKKLNDRVKEGVPNNAKVKAMVAPALEEADIQHTAVGGCPHPNDSGHTKLAGTLKTTFNAI